MRFLHEPPLLSGDALVLTHGAGSNCNSPLLVSVAEAFASQGVTVLRLDLEYREKRPSGPPFPAGAAADRSGLQRAVSEMRTKLNGRIFLGGHSYGGRQASMVAAENAGLIDALLLLSYPLHPPHKPSEMRTAHFPKLQTPALFVQGTRDPFGSPAELRQALKLIPARTMLHEVEKGGHDLKGLKASALPELMQSLLTQRGSPAQTLEQQ